MREDFITDHGTPTVVWQFIRIREYLERNTQPHPETKIESFNSGLTLPWIELQPKLRRKPPQQETNCLHRKILKRHQDFPMSIEVSMGK